MKQNLFFMVVILAADPERISLYDKLLQKSRVPEVNINTVKNDGFKWDEERVKFVITNQPKLILFDNDFSPEDFTRLWLDVAKTIRKNDLKNTQMGIFHSDWCRHFLPQEEYVYIEKIEELKDFT